MSDAELEHAATAPRRLIELCRAGSEKQRYNDPGATLRPRTTRLIDADLRATASLFIVPGGRYLVSDSTKGLFIWDLGYVSRSIDKIGGCELIAFFLPEDGSEDGLEEDEPGNSAYPCMVQATADGMGLIIFSCPLNRCSIFELYPQDDMPQLTRIAHLDLNPDEDPRAACLLPDRVLWHYFHDDSIIFKVWDYRMNYSITFASDIGSGKFTYHPQVIATKTAIIFLCIEEILVWAVPLLPPQPPNFFQQHPSHIPPLSKITFPDSIRPGHPRFESFQTMSHWYCGSSQPLYFNLLCPDAQFHRFEIIVKPDLVDTSLHLISTELVPDGFYNVVFGAYRLCEDTIVGCCGKSDWEGQCGVYAWSRLTTATSQGTPAAQALLPTDNGWNCFLCPASGRCAHVDNGIVVLDLL